MPKDLASLAMGSRASRRNRSRSRWSRSSGDRGSSLLRILSFYSRAPDRLLTLIWTAIGPKLRGNPRERTMKEILLAGAGKIGEMIVNLLTATGGYQVTVIDRSIEQLQRLPASPLLKTRQLDITDPA